MYITTVSASTAEYPRHSEGDTIELKDGSLLLVYMEFGGDGSDFAGTRLARKRSTDGGRTWDEHRVVTVTSPGDVNVYSPNVIRALDGGILLLFMRRHAVPPVDNTYHVWKSVDEGETFEPFAVFAERGPYSLCNAVVKRLSGGRLLLPTVVAAGPADDPGASFAISVLYSDDDGRTWREADNRLGLPMRGAMEPHVEETNEGRLVLIMRNQLGSLFMSASDDGGVSWSKPQTTGLRVPESCPELSRIPATGDLLVIWNNSEYDPAFRSHYGKRSPLSWAISQDGGRTWSEPRTIEDEPGRGYSNPGCRFASDGTAIINYWTCSYTPEWRMQSQIDLRVAVIGTTELYER